MKTLIFAFDFDGTICRHAFPRIGAPKYDTIDLIKKLKKDGHKIILWTCRDGRYLREAVDWSEKHGIVYDAVNENVEGINFKTSKKIFANIYVDDRALNVDDIRKIDKVIFNIK